MGSGEILTGHMIRGPTLDEVSRENDSYAKNPPTRLEVYFYGVFEGGLLEYVFDG